MMPAFIFGGLGIAATAVEVCKGGTRSARPASSHIVEVGSLLRALSDAALLLDERGRILDLNAAAEKLLARPRGQLVGAPADRILGKSVASPAERQKAALAGALKGESVHSGRQLFRTADGDSLTVTFEMSPVRDASGRITGALLTIKDVTEVAHLQGELEAGTRHLAVGEMTAGLVHDFSHVLGTISGAVTVLEAEPKSSERNKTVLGIINKAVREGSQTVSNVRQYLAGRRAESVCVDVPQLLEEVLELTNPALDSHHGVTVVRDMQACDKVQANQDDLRRAFTNLVLNALEAMCESGTLTVDCRPVPSGVQVSVRDTGTGMPHEVQKRIFSSYFTTKPKGTGLGLAGARRAIRAQGGDICFESLPGKGTTFYVTLPTNRCC